MDATSDLHEPIFASDIPRAFWDDTSIHNISNAPFFVPHDLLLTGMEKAHLLLSRDTACAVSLGVERVHCFVVLVVRRRSRCAIWSSPWRQYS